MDILRKLIHMSMGFFALALRWLNPWQAMLCALIAFLHNLYIFPLYGRKKLEKEEEKKRGYTAIVSYPAVVFVIIGLAWVFNPLAPKAVMVVAAGAWAMLAFGDALGAICGMTFKGPKLPWNKDKTWAGLCGFVFFGGVASYFMMGFILEWKIVFSYFHVHHVLPILVPLSIIAAIIESLPDQFDDNLGFPLVTVSLLSFIWIALPAHLILSAFPVVSAGSWLTATLIIVNTVLAATALLKKWVSLWGFIFGLLVGFSVIFSLGWKGFVILCLFYLLANFSTFYGKRIKEERGIAEGNKGIRGLESVFSKGLAPAVFCWLSFEAFVVTLAFYAADTVASEIGKTAERGTHSPTSLKEVPPGTIGAVSNLGILSGTLSIILFLIVSFFVRWPFGDYFATQMFISAYLMLIVLVFMFFYLESVVNELNKRFDLTSKMVIHITLGFLIGAFSNTILMFSWIIS